MATEVYEWTLSGTLGSQFVQTVQHVKATIATPVNPFATALLIAQDMVGGTGPITTMMTVLPVEYIPTSLRVRRVSGSGGATAIVLNGDMTQQVGQRTGEISVSSIGACVIWIPTTAPDKTGRLFVPGISEDDIHDNLLDPTYVAELNTWIADYVQVHSLGGDSYEPAIWRRLTAVSDVIFAGQISTVIGTQRKRLHPV